MPDVARIVGVSLSATKLRAHRGYAAMRAHLGRIEGEEG
jgi:DNA-directed RNA polymerase specialized sigma24 family protein